MLKKISILFALLLAVLTLTAAASSTDATVTGNSALVTFTSEKVMPGENVVVTVSVSTDAPVNSIAISGLEYDTNALELVAINGFEWVEDSCAFSPVFDAEKGIVLIPLEEPQCINDGICTLEFYVDPNATDCCIDINAKVVVKNDSDEFAVDIDNGRVIVYTYIFGDFDMDFDVDIDDAVYLFGHSMIPEYYPLDYPGRLDLDKDGKINIRDASLLFKNSMLPDIYPIEPDFPWFDDDYTEEPEIPEENLPATGVEVHSQGIYLIFDIFDPEEGMDDVAGYFLNIFDSYDPADAGLSYYCASYDPVVWIEAVYFENASYNTIEITTMDHNNVKRGVYTCPLNITRYESSIPASARYSDNGLDITFDCNVTGFMHTVVYSDIKMSEEYDLYYRDIDDCNYLDYAPNAFDDNMLNHITSGNAYARVDGWKADSVESVYGNSLDIMLDIFDTGLIPIVVDGAVAPPDVDETEYAVTNVRFDENGYIRWDSPLEESYDVVYKVYLIDETTGNRDVLAYTLSKFVCITNVFSGKYSLEIQTEVDGTIKATVNPEGLTVSGNPTEMEAYGSLTLTPAEDGFYDMEITGAPANSEMTVYFIDTTDPENFGTGSTFGAYADEDGRAVSVISSSSMDYILKKGYVGAYVIEPFVSEDGTELTVQFSKIIPFQSASNVLVDSGDDETETPSIDGVTDLAVKNIRFEKINGQYFIVWDAPVEQNSRVLYKVCFKMPGNEWNTLTCSTPVNSLTADELLNGTYEIKIETLLDNVAVAETVAEGLLYIGVEGESTNDAVVSLTALADGTYDLKVTGLTPGVWSLVEFIDSTTATYKYSYYTGAIADANGEVYKKLSSSSMQYYLNGSASVYEMGWTLDETGNILTLEYNSVATMISVSELLNGEGTEAPEVPEAPSIDGVTDFAVSNIRFTESGMIEWDTPVAENDRVRYEVDLISADGTWTMLSRTSQNRMWISKVIEGTYSVAVKTRVDGVDVATVVAEDVTITGNIDKADSYAEIKLTARADDDLYDMEITGAPAYSSYTVYFMDTMDVLNYGSGCSFGGSTDKDGNAKSTIGASSLETILFNGYVAAYSSESTLSEDNSSLNVTFYEIVPVHEAIETLMGKNETPDIDW